MKRMTLMTFVFSGLIAIACNNNSSPAGYTSIVEGTAVQVPALTGGRIIRLPVDEGDTVTRGMLLAAIDTTELVLQREQLRATLEDLSVQQRMAATALKQAESNYRYVQEKQQRTASLFEKSSASRQMLDDVINAADQAGSALEAARQNFGSIAARQKQVEAQLKIVNKKINDALITAPIGGVVTEKYYEIGEAVAPLSPVMEIIDISEVTVKIYISQKMLAAVRHGQAARVQVDGLEEQLNGTVSWISPRAEFTPKSILTPETRTSLVYAVKVTVKNPDGILKHGMPVEVYLD